MSNTITRQLDALTAFSESEKGQLPLMRGMRGAVWIMADQVIIDFRVWDRLWELGDLEHIEYDLGPKKIPLKVLRITDQGLRRLEDK